MKNSEQDITQSSEILQVRWLRCAQLLCPVTTRQDSVLTLREPRNLLAPRALEHCHAEQLPVLRRGSWQLQLMRTANGSCRSARKQLPP